MIKIVQDILKAGSRLALLLTVAASAASAQESFRNDFQSCYDNLRNQAPGPVERELFVIIDQTLPFAVDLKRHAHRKVHGYLKPGDRINIMTFSANAQERYAALKMAGNLDPQLPEEVRYNTGKTDLRKFDRCVRDNNQDLKNRIDQTMKEAFAKATTDLKHTELMGSLAVFAEGVISNSKTPKKTVLIISDMMENSETISFYTNPLESLSEKSINQLVERAEMNSLIGNMGGATVNVIGAGFSAKPRYRSQTSLNKLKSFWESYFTNAEAELVGWGQPQLFPPLR